MIVYHDIISDEVTEQTKSLPGYEFDKVVVTPVQQQSNGCDCGEFAIAYVTCVVYTKDPLTAGFDIPKRRPHLLHCPKSGHMNLLPTTFS